MLNRRQFMLLAGLFIVNDAEEEALKLPRGDFELPLVIQDRTFDDENRLVYLTHPMERMIGFLGNRILVNGRPRYRHRVASRPYRLRILNGSNSRIVNLAWSDGRPLTVIGTDGGLLAAPLERPNVILPPAERVSAANRGTPRRFQTFMHHMTGTINNRVFEMTGVADDEVVRLDTSEVWEFVNRGACRPCRIPCTCTGCSSGSWGALGGLYDGYLDTGWKDTVLVMPDERVRLLMRFADYDGLFLYHCHNLEHEDMGMMRNYYVRAA